MHGIGHGLAITWQFLVKQTVQKQTLLEMARAGETKTHKINEPFKP